MTYDDICFLWIRLDKILLWCLFDVKYSGFICNGLKQTISAGGGFELLQMVLEPDTERCASEDAGPKGGGL